MPQAQLIARDPAPQVLLRSAEDVADPGQLLRGILRRWRYWSGLCVLGAVIGFLLTQVMPDRYTAQALIVLDSRAMRVVSAQDALVSDLELTNPVVETAVATLRADAASDAVLAKVGKDRLGAAPRDAPDGPGPLRRFAIWLGIAPPVQTGAAADDIASDDTGAAQRLRDSLRVTRVGSSYLIEVAATTADPALSRDIANVVSAHFIAGRLAERHRIAAEATGWLAGQVALRETALAEAEARVDMAKQRLLTGGGQTALLLDQQITELVRLLAQTRSERAMRQAWLDGAARGETSLAGLPEAAVDALTALRAEQAAQTRALALAAQTLGPRHADRRAAEAALTRTKADLADAIAALQDQQGAEISALQTREAVLTTEIARTEAQISAQATGTGALRQLEAEAAIARDSYESLLARLGEIRTQADLQQAEARLVAPAVLPDTRAAPRTGLVTGFGASLGLSIGLLVVVLSEVLGAGVSTAAALERLTGLRVLSVLPDANLPRPASVLPLVQGPGASLIGERLRLVQAVLTREAPAEGSQVILVTSSLPDEGKSTTALALARGFAAAGRPTVLLDLDTRASTLNDVLDDGAAPMFRHLSGVPALDRVSAATTGFGFDYVGLRGGEPGHATESLALLQRLRQAYDVVIIDAPPVVPVADALAVAPAADQLLYLVAWRHTPRRAVEAGLTAIANIGVVPTGLVMTRSQDETAAYPRYLPRAA